MGGGGSRGSVRWRRLTALLLFLGACGACAHASGPPPEVYIRQGRDYQDRGLPFEASLAFRKALRTDPGNREARLLLAAVSVGTGAHRQAIDQYRRLLAADPADVEATTGLCRVYALTGTQTAWALERMAPLAALPGVRQHLSLEILGMLQMNQRRHAEARVSLELALSLIQRGAVTADSADRVRIERLLRRAKIDE